MKGRKGNFAVLVWVEGFGHTVWHVGSYSSHQDQTCAPMNWKESLNHWPAGKVLGWQFLDHQQQ